MPQMAVHVGQHTLQPVRALHRAAPLAVGGADNLAARKAAARQQHVNRTWSDLRSNLEDPTAAKLIDAMTINFVAILIVLFTAVPALAAERPPRVIVETDA